jgi:fatty acid desaturase
VGGWITTSLHSTRLTGSLIRRQLHGLQVGTIPVRGRLDTASNCYYEVYSVMADNDETLFPPKTRRNEAPYLLNAWLTAASLAAAVLQLVVVPAFWLPQAPLSACIIVFLLSLITPISRALLHEAIHGRLLKPRSWNDVFGRILAVTSGIAFDAIRFGHLTHHRFPRHALDRADIIEPGANRILAVAQFYVGLVGGIYLREVLWAAILLLPRRMIEFLTDRALKSDKTVGVLQAAVRRNLDRRLARCRIDLLCVAVLYGGSLYLYGRWWPILLVWITVRALIISLQDNVAHYGTSAELGAEAHNSRASRGLSLFILNQHLHGVHHDRPEVPWNKLPQTFEAAGKHYAGSYLRLLLRQFLGPRESFASRDS